MHVVLGGFCSLSVGCLTKGITNCSAESNMQFVLKHLVKLHNFQSSSSAKNFTSYILTESEVMHEQCYYFYPT